MISIKDLKKVYGKQTVLNGVTTTIQKGQVVAIVGSSGSGKSTLLRCVNRLETPDAGEVSLNGVRVTPETLPQIREKVGMVFQNFNLFSHMTVMQNLIYAPTHVKGMAKDAAIEKAKTLLAQVGLAHKAESYPQRLSGGEKQRIAIARTLMLDPEVILFDEPTSALDPEMVQEVLRVIKSLSSTGITMLIVTHEMAFVRDVADRVLFVDRGKIIEDRETEDFFECHDNDRVIAFLNKKKS